MRATYIPDLPAIHAREISFLWSQRQAGMRNPLTVVREIQDLEQRITAHAEALWLNPQAAIATLRPMLASDDMDDIFASAWLLCEYGDSAAQKIVSDAITTVPVENRHAIVRAICLSNKSATASFITSGQTDIPTLFQQAEIAAFKSPKQCPPLNAYLKHDDSEVRLKAWQLASLNPARITFEQGMAGVFDNDPRVSEVAMNVVAWCGHTLLEHCRRAVAKYEPSSLAELRMLAVLGTLEDRLLIAAASENKILGATRYSIQATCGYPDAITGYIKGMADTDAVTAIAAGEAFTRVTGCALKKSVFWLKKQKEEAVDVNTQEEQVMPSSEDAARQWNDIKGRFVADRRYSGGIDITEKPTDWSEVDMQSRWEYHMRNAYYGKPHLTPVELELFPLCLESISLFADSSNPQNSQQSSQPETYLVQFPRKHGSTTT